MKTNGKITIIGEVSKNTAGDFLMYNQGFLYDHTSKINNGEEHVFKSYDSREIEITYDTSEDLILLSKSRYTVADLAAIIEKANDLIGVRREKS